jgi:hypothetical protein
MLCLAMHSNVMLRFMVQALQDPPLCSSTIRKDHFVTYALSLFTTLCLAHVGAGEVARHVHEVEGAVLLVLLRVHGEGQVQVTAEGGVNHLRAHAHGGQPLVDGRRRAGTKEKTTFRITTRRSELQQKSL